MKRFLNQNFGLIVAMLLAIIGILLMGLIFRVTNPPVLKPEPTRIPMDFTIVVMGEKSHPALDVYDEDLAFDQSCRTMFYALANSKDMPAIGVYDTVKKVDTKVNLPNLSNGSVLNVQLSPSGDKLAGVVYYYTGVPDKHFGRSIFVVDLVPATTLAPAQIIPDSARYVTPTGPKVDILEYKWHANGDSLVYAPEDSQQYFDVRVLSAAELNNSPKTLEEYTFPITKANWDGPTYLNTSKNANFSDEKQDDGHYYNIAETATCATP